MTFYEVHDEEGCLVKTKQIEVAKRTALAFMTMKSGRKVHIRKYADDPGNPRIAIRLDPHTRTWSQPEPLPLGATGA
jgi:hypothetical protein